MPIEIRQARPNDRGPIAELIYSSGMDVYQYLYGDQCIDFLEYEFASGEGFAGYRNVTVAVKDGTVVGTGCFYDAERYPELVKGSLDNMVAFFDTNIIETVMTHIGHTAKVMKAPRDGELYLSNFGVDQHCRSQGIGSQMIQQVLEQARRDNYSVFGLDVSDANPRGQALYTRLGLEVIEKKTFPIEDAGVAPAYKMELVLR
jgi:ribosomal protein S18 acetylase RimI-like enzyme